MLPLLCHGLPAGAMTSNEEEEQARWHYLDASQTPQGPFPINYLQSERRTVSSLATHPPGSLPAGLASITSAYLLACTHLPGQ